MTELDFVRLDVIVGSIRASMQQAISYMFNARSKEFEALIDKAIAEYDWQKAIDRAIESELDRHARAFAENSLRKVSRDWDKYAEIQKECDELVRARLAKLWLDTQAATD